MIIKKIETGYLSENCYVISVGNDCLIIDPGDDFIKIKKEVGSKNALAVLITHYHFDHVGALNDVKEEYNLGVIDYKSDCNQKVGPFNFKIIKTPGHKEDSVTYYFEDNNVMFTGDFLFKGSIGRCDLLGGNVFDMKKSIKKIKGYDPSIKIYPGHGENSCLKDEILNNPYMRGDYDE